jgi:hypothetical protein
VIRKQTRLPDRRRSAVVVVLMMTFALALVPVGVGHLDSQAFAAEGSAESSHGVGIKVASWLLTIPYCLGKVVYAVTGSVVGGFTYVLSGGNTEAAKAVWTSSLHGTYIIRPEHLKGDEPVQFVGRAEDRQG